MRGYIHVTLYMVQKHFALVVCLLLSKYRGPKPLVMYLKQPLLGFSNMILTGSLTFKSIEP